MLAVTIHIVAAVFLGIVIAIAMFVVRMSRSNIRRKYRCHTIHSRRARAPREAAVSRASNGRRILVLELHGPLFFGTAEMLSGEIDALRATGHALGDHRHASNDGDRRDRARQILAEIGDSAGA